MPCLDIWVEQWPIIKPKLTALKELVNDQLRLGHLKPSTNRHNTPIFVIYRRSSHYWLIQDLYAVNEQMEKKWVPHSPTCPIPVPSPFSPYLYLTHQGLFFFFSDPWAPANKCHFAFTSQSGSLPCSDLAKDTNGWSCPKEWKLILLSASSVSQAFHNVPKDVLLDHYMDGILLVQLDTQYLRRVSFTLLEDLMVLNLQAALEKLQSSPP